MYHHALLTDEEHNGENHYEELNETCHMTKHIGAF
jgi:hypothetical protein